LWGATNCDRHEKSFLASGYAVTVTKIESNVGKYLYI